MRFLLDTEHLDLAGSIDAMLARADMPAVVRAWNDGDHAPGRAVWRRLADTGVTALLVPEEAGGVGAGAVEMVVAAEQLGRHCVPGPVAETIAVVPTVLSTAGRADLLDPLLTGGLATIAVPDEVPYAADAAVADLVLLLQDSTLFSAETDITHASVDRSRTVSTVVARESVATHVDARRALEFGALATAAQLVGLASAMLSTASDHARNRTQFGRPIGSFQAVKHHLADVAIAVEMARPLVHGAALAVDAGAATTGRDVSAAKVACGRAADLAARTALQTLGAIGYTAEHDLSLYMTKTRALQSAWGTAARHRRTVLAAITA
ncbi:acyl-CoA dehydrogenase family protein [Williamsia sp. MIQD14]|uniref:acyl-CoA dehydrogenase family protein n=1 Tax=Williamsia sp. MIQD14 TaxID=3425703 RepID=UPI003DA06283